MTFFDAMQRLSRSSTSPLLIGGLELSHPERVEPFFQQNTDAVFFFNHLGEIVYFNENLPRMLGYSEDTLYNHFAVFSPPEQNDSVTTFFERALAGETVHYTAQGLHIDQHRLTLKITNMPIEQDGQVVGVYGIARDITREKQLEEDVVQIRSQLELTEQIPELVVFHYDPQARTIEYSPSLINYLGLGPEQLKELSNEQLHKRIHPRDFDPLRFHMIRLLDGEIETFEQEVSVLNAKNQYQLLRLKALRRDDQSGLISLILYDLSEVSEARRQLALEREQTREIYEALDAAISQIDLSTGRLLFHSKGFFQIFEELPEDLILSQDWLFERLDPRDVTAMKQFIRRLTSGKSSTIQYRLVFPDGRCKWIEDQQIPVFQLDGSIAYTNSIMHDITLQKEYEERLQQLAMHDSVTGLPNRISLTETIKDWMQTNTTFSILSISFNRISEINNAFGHASGDQWIQATSALLYTSKPDEVFFGHLGGDEYAMLIPSCFKQDVTSCAEALLTLSAAPILIEPYALFARVSIGISRFPDDSHDPIELMKHSYTALRRSRREDHSAVHHYASNLDIDYYRRYRLEQDLHYAIERNQLFLEYQPKVDSWTGKIIGLEALIRWQHPEWGRIPPNDFIPLAEESALHIAIGDWVVETACQAMVNWSRAGAELVPISVNVSPKRFLIPGFEHQIEQALTTYKLSADLLELEITEAALIMDDPNISRTLEHLSQLGVRIALDDFGKGYSSMVYLQRYPINVIKIDRQFATHIAEDRKAQAIVKSILYMATEFNLAVIAEGIETLQQLEMFRSLNCPNIQGYLFSRPVSAEVMESFLLREVLYPIEACSLASDTVPSFSVPGKIKMLKHQNQALDFSFSNIQAHRTSTRHLYFTTKTPLPLQTATFEVRLAEGIQMVSCTLSIITIEQGQYVGQYETVQEAELVLRFFQSLRYIG
ncbi:MULTISPECIES: GGDEF domain-containing phosphodiesterase [Exiguobacterium]|uniref:sensor domain-containing protein n=1 Tax=Exiguobacterium TaxID=33986 RepID=UPI001AE5CC8F|nr:MULTISPECIES: GGDEF domain-containing phosphodiesterase [Exiguobacterium]MCT4779299.1 EAL domain-containing protein [Exiguobacterium soli]